MPTTDDVLGNLPDALSCTVTRDTSGGFEIELTYPRQGRNVQALKINNWLYAPCGGTMGRQYFRIDQLSEDISGELSVHGQHASYNALAILAAPFIAQPTTATDVSFFTWYSSLVSAVERIDASQMGSFAVIGYTDEMRLNPAVYDQPVSLKQAVLDAIEDLTDVYLDYDKMGLKLWQLPSFNVDPAFRIRYGLDMMGFSSEVDATEFYTHIFPYYLANNTFKTDGMMVYPLNELPADMIDFRRIKALDLSELSKDLDENSTESEIHAVVNRWILEHPWNHFPDEISVESIGQDQNSYELGAVGKIYYEPTGTVITAHIVSLTYDVLADRVTTIGVNKRTKDITDTISQLL